MNQTPGTHTSLLFPATGCLTSHYLVPTESALNNKSIGRMEQLNRNNPTNHKTNSQWSTRDATIHGGWDGLEIGKVEHD